MDDADRFRIGQRVRCLVRGEVVITGITDTPIPWPIGKFGRGRSLVVYKGLARAIRRESNQAVCFWWGITPQTVSKWRKLLSVPRATAGTSRLHSEYATSEPAMAAGRRKGQAKARDPERRRKIAESRRGKPRPPHVVEAVRRAHLGTHHSEEACRKMSEAHKRRGTLVPGTKVWTPEEDELLRTLPIAKVVKKTGRSMMAVRTRRSRLGLPDARRRERECRR
jgi:hypothetical protein